MHVSWFDAQAYCEWAGGRLLTEAEWEYAARGGLDRQPFVWGSEPLDDGEQKLNIWQGCFPSSNTEVDGFYSTSPVGTFPANGYGLLDMASNVWEWVADWYRPDTYTRNAVNDVIENPAGPEFELRSAGSPIRPNASRVADPSCAATTIAQATVPPPV